MKREGLGVKVKGKSFQVRGQPRLKVRLRLSIFKGGIELGRISTLLAMPDPGGGT